MPPDARLCSGKNSRSSSAFSSDVLARYGGSLRRRHDDSFDDALCLYRLDGNSASPIVRLVDRADVLGNVL
jgi:hypothetical protein